MLKFDVSQAGAGTSTVNEFVDAKINTSATADMKRFSFDIRALLIYQNTG